METVQKTPCPQNYRSSATQIWSFDFHGRQIIAKPIIETLGRDSFWALSVVNKRFLGAVSTALPKNKEIIRHFEVALLSKRNAKCTTTKLILSSSILNLLKKTTFKIKTKSEYNSNCSLIAASAVEYRELESDTLRAKYRVKAGLIAGRYCAHNRSINNFRTAIEIIKRSPEHAIQDAFQLSRSILNRIAFTCGKTPSPLFNKMYTLICEIFPENTLEKPADRELSLHKSVIRSRNITMPEIDGAETAAIAALKKAAGLIMKANLK